MIKLILKDAKVTIEKVTLAKGGSTFSLLHPYQSFFDRLFSGLENYSIIKMTRRERLSISFSG